MHGSLLLDASDWERGHGYETVWGKFQVGIWALGIAGENCAEVTRRQICAVQISSDCPRDLARLEGSSTQFLEWSSSDSSGPWQKKLCNSSRELTMGYGKD